MWKLSAGVERGEAGQAVLDRAGAVNVSLQRSRTEAGGRELRGMASRMGIPH